MATRTYEENRRRLRQSRQRKESIVTEKKNENKSVETNNNKNNKTEKKTREPKSHPKYMVYPVARGPNEITGDTLQIRCLEYIPPDTTSSYQYTLSYANKKGKDQYGNKYFKNDPLRGKDGNVTTEIAPGTFKMVNQGASDRLTSNSSGHEKSIFYVELPIPQDVNDSNSVTWGDDSLNILQLAGMAATQEILKNPKQSFDQAKN